MGTLPLLTTKTTEMLSDLFKTLGDSTRIKIICSLFQGEKCVHEISDLLEMTPSAVSHQLRILKQSSLAKCRRDGRHMRYSLDDNHVEEIFRLGLIHIEHIHKEPLK